MQKLLTAVVALHIGFGMAHFAIASNPTCPPSHPSTETMEDLCDDVGNTPLTTCLRDITDEFDENGYDVLPLAGSDTHADNAAKAGIPWGEACGLALAGGSGSGTGN